MPDKGAGMQRTEDKSGFGYVIAQLGLLGALASLLLPWMSATLPGASPVVGRGLDIARGVTGPGISLAPSMATRPSAIMRSISRRDAIPARASSLAIRSPVLAPCRGDSVGDGGDIRRAIQRVGVRRKILVRREPWPG